MGPTDPAEAHFNKGLWGFVGGVWQKLPMLWGYSDVVSEAVSADDVDAGTNNLYTTAVPAGEVHIIESAFMLNLGGACDYHHMRAYVDGVYCSVLYQADPVIGTYYAWDGRITLGPGDKLRFIFGGCAALTDISAAIAGYKMDIDL